MAEPEGGGVTPEGRAYKRGFKQKNKRDDYALDLFDEARRTLATDPDRVNRVLRQLSSLYNAVTNKPIVDLPTHGRIMQLIEAGRLTEAEALLDAQYQLYAPIDDAEREAPG